MVKKLPMIILPSSSGSRRLMPHHLKNAATATSIEKLRAASSVISQLVGRVVAEERQLEMLVRPDQIGVENFLVGEQRDRHRRDQEAERQAPASFARLKAARQKEIERDHAAAR